MSLILQYISYAKTVSNREEFARNPAQPKLALD